MSPNGTRAGVILYGSDPQLSIGLNDYGTFLEFYTLLDNVTWQGGEHQLHKVNKQAFVCLFVLFFMEWLSKENDSTNHILLSTGIRKTA